MPQSLVWRRKQEGWLEYGCKRDKRYGCICAHQIKETGINYQTCLQLFAQEEFLRKLEMSGYAENLVLKGGMFLYTISNYEGRPTMDIDFMLRRMSNDVAGMKTIMEEICQTDTHNDFISMEVLGTRKITPEKKYPGIGINLMAHIKNVSTTARR